ncbi:MAG: LysR family transcriptional regulator [Chromatiales bacterium]|nr:LysR family transcriptional regulator [Chromatiales bacterium]
MNNINWDGLRYFVAAAEAGSLTAAARALDSNQPTVGRHIDNLEQELAVKLFQRTVKGLTLTQDGVALLEHARLIQEQMVKLERTLGDDSGLNGKVRIALPEGLCHEVVVPQLQGFYRDYPSISLELNVSPSTANLTQGEADMAIRLFRPTESNLVARRLAQMPLGLYASQEYLKNFGTPVRTEELSRHRLIAYGEQLASLPENRWLLEQAATMAPALCSDSTSSRLRATVAGVGIGVHPHLFARNHPQLVQVLKSVELNEHEMWLVYHRDVREMPRVRAVADFIVSVLG